VTITGTNDPRLEHSDVGGSRAENTAPHARLPRGVVNDSTAQLTPMAEIAL
jgi:hypothetical protein